MGQIHSFSQRSLCARNRSNLGLPLPGPLILKSLSNFLKYGFQKGFHHKGGTAILLPPVKPIFRGFGVSRISPVASRHSGSKMQQWD
jgi:hypothetical protein